MTLGKRQREAETKAQQPTQTGAEKRQKIAQTQSFVRGRGQSTAPKEGKGVLIEELRNRDFIYGKRSSYPDELLELPEADATKIILSKAPLNSSCSGLFSWGIHVGPVVSSVPKNIELIIAKGSQFLFPRRISATLPKVALNDLFNRLRWKYFFLNSDDTENIYDPNFAIRRTEIGISGDPCPREVEEDFQDAESELYRQLKDIAPDVRRSDAQSRADLSTLERYLTIEGLMLKQSDKNLGLCLVKKDWYLEELRNMLDNDPCYRGVTLDFAQQETTRLLNRLKTMQMGSLPPAQRKFLRNAFEGLEDFRWP